MLRRVLYHPHGAHPQTSIRMLANKSQAARPCCGHRAAGQLAPFGDVSRTLHPLEEAGENCTVELATPQPYMELVDRVGDSCRFRQALQSVFDFLVTSLFPCRRNPHEVAFDSHPPAPMSFQGVIVGLVRLVDEWFSWTEGFGEQLMGCFFGELLAHPCGLQQQGRAHVFQEDGGRFLDKLSTVVAADEEQIHFGSRFQYAPDFSHRGLRIGGPMKGENAEQIVDRAGFQRDVLERPVPDLNIAKWLNPAKRQVPHVLGRLDADELDHGLGPGGQARERSPGSAANIEDEPIIVLKVDGGQSFVGGLTPARTQIQLVVVVFGKSGISLDDWIGEFCCRGGQFCRFLKVIRHKPFTMQNSPGSTSVRSIWQPLWVSMNTIRSMNPKESNRPLAIKSVSAEISPFGEYPGR